jgi:hypothetical protein
MDIVERRIQVGDSRRLFSTTIRPKEEERWGKELNIGQTNGLTGSMVFLRTRFTTSNLECVVVDQPTRPRNPLQMFCAPSSNLFVITIYLSLHQSLPAPRIRMIMGLTSE